ncbi:MAG: hypothetical protein R8G34_17775 [Paracoccaceae bacterium]|nr:hypothetical protein [Paracoccaceae bacterium]
MTKHDRFPLRAPSSKGSPARMNTAHKKIWPSGVLLMTMEKVSWYPIRCGTTIRFRQLQQNCRWKTWPAQVTGEEFASEEAAQFQFIKHRKQGVAVLAVTQAKKPASLTSLNHPRSLDGFADMTHDPIFYACGIPSTAAH